MAKLYKKESFLRNAKSIDNFYLDVNYLAPMRPTTRDVEWTIDNRYDERPDTLAYELYGSSRYWWVFANRNPDILKDPIRDFKAGVTIFLPSEETVFNVTR